MRVSDATSPAVSEQEAQVEEVLRELESNNKPRLHVMNRIDLLSEIKRESLIDTDSVIHVSAQQGEGLDNLLARIDQLIEQDPVSRARLRVPQSEGKALAAIDAQSRGHGERVPRRLCGD